MINASELRAVIERPGRDPVYRRNVLNDGSAKLRYFSELYVRLHNYVAVIATLVDVGRNYTRRLSEEDFRAEQAIRNRVLAQSSAGLVLRDLRNYMVYKGVPHMEFVVKRTVSPDETQSRLQMSSDHLLEWDGWKPGAKQYLQAVQMVDVGKLVDEYSRLAEDYYSWFWAQVSGDSN